MFTGRKKHVLYFLQNRLNRYDLYLAVISVFHQLFPFGFLPLPRRFERYNLSAIRIFRCFSSHNPRKLRQTAMSDHDESFAWPSGTKGKWRQLLIGDMNTCVVMVLLLKSLSNTQDTIGTSLSLMVAVYRVLVADNYRMLARLVASMWTRSFLGAYKYTYQCQGWSDKILKCQVFLGHSPFWRTVVNYWWMFCILKGVFSNLKSWSSKCKNWTLPWGKLINVYLIKLFYSCFFTTYWI